MNLNVFKEFPFTKHYYLTHPLEFVRQIFYNLKMAWQRATKGYCYADLWSLDCFLLQLIPTTLREFSNKTIGWPELEYASVDDWRAALLLLASNFEELQLSNSKWDDYKLYPVRQERLRQAFNDLSDILNNLWI